MYHCWQYRRLSWRWIHPTRMLELQKTYELLSKLCVMLTLNTTVFKLILQNNRFYTLPPYYTKPPFYHTPKKYSILVLLKHNRDCSYFILHTKTNLPRILPVCLQTRQVVSSTFFKSCNKSPPKRRKSTPFWQTTKNSADLSICLFFFIHSYKD